MNDVPLRRFTAPVVLICALAVHACTAGPQMQNPAIGTTPASQALPRAAVGTFIKHVVIVVQENRSFENIFAGFPGADAPLFGYNRHGLRVSLQPHDFSGPDLPHTWGSALSDWDRGKMDGFGWPEVDEPVGKYAYSYLDRADSAPYWQMAHRYVLADRMFPTMFGVSFTAHLDLIASTAQLCCGYSEVNWPTHAPWGCDAPSGTTTYLIDATRIVRAGGPFPCFTSIRTLASTLDAAGVSWKYYAPLVDAFSGGELWTSFDAISGVRYGADWRNVVSPPSTILTDAAAGRLPGVSWVIPDLLDSDHAGTHSNTGPSWVASVVNAIGEGPDWDSTAIVVLWDDWGGWYDDARPPQLDFRGLGIRVPCVIISAYAPRGHVSHTQYEFGSIIKLVEETFGLPPLGTLAQGYTDGRAQALDDVFDFTRSPRSFKPITAKYPRQFFTQRIPSRRAPDDD